MPLASSIAAPRLVAALLLIIDFVGAAPLLPNAWRHADRKADGDHRARRAGRRARRHLVAEPARSRHDALDHLRLRGRAAVAAAVGLALSRQGPFALSVGIGGALRLLQRAGADRRPADRRLLARPADRLADRARQHRAVLRRLRFLLGRELCGRAADQSRMRSGSRCSSARSTPSASARRIAVRPRQRSAVPRASATP